MYEGMRLLPCVSTPRRSADTRHLETISAWAGDVLFAMRICLTKFWRSVWLMLCICWGLLGCSAILEFGVRLILIFDVLQADLRLWFVVLRVSSSVEVLL